MQHRIKISVEGRELHGSLTDSESARALRTRLPLEVRMSRWGEEYYGDLGEPLGVSQSTDARTEMAVGELAYWPPGNALCVFFGPTPASAGDEPRAASEVNPLGRLAGDVAATLTELDGSVSMRIEIAE